MTGPEDELSEEHERQICRFMKKDYVPGERLRMLGLGRAMVLNHRLMEEAARKKKDGGA
ncbi:hypothetical protein G5V57_18130 [Nordella sp. HKS 07]|uniref:hypothetical protein n=1 Tax=Nordella sp. HKS 07 TaxID=2712222 RepID=UPI0013E0F00F|nr:hypothetical protein [Nordella sp. HKS 07]QIG49464.1 hypothetical protein G5V57_18130 [Nordella sp. HKS 07]